MGQSQEDSEAWWADVESFTQFKKLSEEEKVGLIPLLLKEGAKQWFKTLPAANKDTFAHIREAFQDQYKRDDVYKWRDAADMWGTVQQPGQTVEEYYTAVIKKAGRAKMAEVQILFSLINGLKKNIRQVVMQKEPKTIQDVKKWAMIAETSGDETDNSTLVEAVKQLTDRLNAATVQEMAGTTSSRRPTSPRVSFGDTGRQRGDSTERSSGENYYDQSTTWGQRSPRPGNFSRPQRGRGTMTYSSFRGSRANQQGTWRQPSSDVSQTPQPGSGWEERLQPNQHTGECLQCGLIHHSTARGCPARGRTCHNCGKYNHFHSVCRQARNYAMPR